MANQTINITNSSICFAFMGWSYTMFCSLCAFTLRSKQFIFRTCINCNQLNIWFSNILPQNEGRGHNGQF